MDAIILAGGDGKRLGLDIPKALVDINGKTLIERQIDYLNKQLYDEISNLLPLIWVCIRKDDEEIFHGKMGCKGNIIIEEEKEKLGTAGAVKNVLRKKYCSNNFIVFNCDDIVNINLKKMSVNSIAVTHPRLPYGEVTFEEQPYADIDYFYGRTKLKQKMQILEFIEKPLLKNIWVSCGWYHFNKSIYKFLPDTGDLERDVFPKMAKKGLLKAFKYTGRWLL